MNEVLLLVEELKVAIIIVINCNSVVAFRILVRGNLVLE